MTDARDLSDEEQELQPAAHGRGHTNRGAGFPDYAEKVIGGEADDCRGMFMERFLPSWSVACS